MSRNFNEDTRVKIPATAHFLRLGYRYLVLPSQKDKDDIIDFNTKIFKKEFKASLEKINNKEFSDSEILSILSQINSTIQNNDLGKSFYNLLLNADTFKLIDFENIENNDFIIVDELPFSIIPKSDEGSFRPDINILINGIPLAFLEVKKPNNDGGIEAEFERMINKRLRIDEYKKYFNLLQICAFSNNMPYEDMGQSETTLIKQGSFYTTPNGWANTSFSRFREKEPNYLLNYNYLDISDEQIDEIITSQHYNLDIKNDEFYTNLKATSPCNSFITSLFDKERFLFILKYGIMYLTKKGTLQKHIMRYPQFFATRNIIKKLQINEKRGVIWHTQGSGKTALAAFANKIIYDFYSKQDTTARFFFITDRLDLATQAKDEFEQRNFKVTTCKNKDEFTTELGNDPTKLNDNIGEFCVANIHKLESEIKPQTKDYHSNKQKIIFIDEAHRSYSNDGEFYANLITCDKDAVFIALTGTPILKENESTKVKFGDYIDKYFYNDSISDGYTLNIKREYIETKAKAQILHNIEIEKEKNKKADIYNTATFINDISAYINKDFRDFRYIQNDNDLGAMIVCSSNDQAQKIQAWFKANSSFKTALILSDEENKENKENQKLFRETTQIDILIVHFMLTTGYDAPRLKKLYLLREPKDQNLLQTITRVNRPYKQMKLGYLVDFIDIAKSYESTMKEYLKELESDLPPDTLPIKDIEIILKEQEALKEELLDFTGQIENKERFEKTLNKLDKSELYKVKAILESIKRNHIELKLSHKEDEIPQNESENIKALLNSTNAVIKNKQVKENPSNFTYINNDELVTIAYYFVRTLFEILKLPELDEKDSQDKTADELKEALSDLQQAQSSVKNKQNPEYQRLEEMLKALFEKLQIKADVKYEPNFIANIQKEIFNLNKEYLTIANKEQERLKEFDGHNSFLQMIDTASDYGISSDEMYQVMLAIYNNIRNELKSTSIIKQGEQNFISKIEETFYKDSTFNHICDTLDESSGTILRDFYRTFALEAQLNQ